MCLLIASWSEERGRKVGAVIVGDGNVIVATGFNGLPRGISSHDEVRHNRETREKYLWFEHAERNAIYNAARIGGRLAGCRIYVNIFPCADCARAIIQSGLSELITTYPDDSEAVFFESMRVASALLEESGVIVKYV